MTSFRIALWVGLKSVSCLCMLPEEPPTGPDAPPSPSSDGTLAIQVVGPDGAPIEGAVVDLWRVRCRFLRLEGDDGFNQERRTAQELGKGNYRFDRPPPGSYSIRVRAAGFATGWSHWDVHCDEPVRVRLDPERPIAGVVLGRNGNPIEGADIQAGSDLLGLGPESEARSDFAGRFTLHGLDEGELEVCASADGFTDDEKERVPAGTVGLRFTLTPAAPFEGKIVAEDDGHPVAGARVSVSCLRDAPFAGRTDAQGRFRVRRVPAHCRSLWVSHEDFIHERLDPAVVEEREHRGPLVIALHRGFSVAGKVIDAANGGPITGATVVTWPSGEEESKCNERSVKTATDGSFRLKCLPQGTWVLHVRKKGCIEARLPVELGEGGDALDIFLRLEKGGSITGRVLDSEGNPVENAHVTPAIDSKARGENCRVMVEQTVTTDPEGRFRVEGVPASATCCLLASHWDFTPQWMDGIQTRGGGRARGIVMRLLKGGTIHGRVINRRGIGVPMACVSVELNCPECLQRDYDVRCLMSSWAVTDDAGSFSLTRVHPGPSRIEVMMATVEQFVTRETTLVREGDSTDGVDLVLEN